jgi:hypothetical protein
MATGMRVSAVVALIVAIGVVFVLPARTRPGLAALPQPGDGAAQPDGEAIQPGSGTVQPPGTSSIAESAQAT